MAVSVVLSKTNAHGETTLVRSCKKNQLFWLFLGLDTVDADALFAAVHPSLNNAGRLIFGNGPDDQLSAHPEGIMEQRESSQL
jgi:hypothetical protein